MADEDEAGRGTRGLCVGRIGVLRIGGLEEEVEEAEEVAGVGGVLDGALGRREAVVGDRDGAARAAGEAAG